MKNFNKALISAVAPAVFYGIETAINSKFPDKKPSPNPNNPDSMPASRRGSNAMKRYSTSRTTTTTKRRVKKQKTGLKSAILGVSEAKHNTNHAAQAMTSTDMCSFSPTQAVIQGNTRQTRNADEIYLEALKLRGFFNTDAVDNAYSYRLMVLYSEKEYSNSTGGAAGSRPYETASFTRSDLFQDNTGTAPAIAGVVDAKRCSVIFDKTYDINSNSTSFDIVTISETIQLQKKFPYRTEGGAYGKNTNLYIVIIPYHIPKDGHTTYGGFTIDSDLIFKE